LVVSCCAVGQTYTIQTFAGGGLPVNIPGTSASLDYPSSVAVDGAGNLFFVDANHVVLRWNASTAVLTLVAGNGIKGYSGDNGPATSAQLNYPAGVAVDSAGNLYIADDVLYSNGFNGYSPGNGRIRKVSNGVITAVSGGGSGGDNGPATSAQLSGICDVAVDSAGVLYIADPGNDRIREVSNGVIVTVAGNGTRGFSGDGGPATGAQLYGPDGVAVNSAGNLFIADTDNDRIRVLIPSGASCSVSVAPLALSPAASGGDLTVTIRTSPSCAWAIQSLPGWITFSGAAVGTGPGNVTLSVAANSGGPRTAPSPLPESRFRSLSNPFSGGGGNRVRHRYHHPGSGSVAYQVAANLGAARSGSLIVAGLPFTVEQAGATVTGSFPAVRWRRWLRGASGTPPSRSSTPAQRRRGTYPPVCTAPFSIFSAAARPMRMQSGMPMPV
jgi:hypothetical protein